MVKCLIKIQNVDRLLSCFFKVKILLFCDPHTIVGLKNLIRFESANHGEKNNPPPKKETPQWKKDQVTTNEKAKKDESEDKKVCNNCKGKERKIKWTIHIEPPIQKIVSSQKVMQL